MLTGNIADWQIVPDLHDNIFAYHSSESAKILLKIAHKYCLCKTWGQALSSYVMYVRPLLHVIL